MAEAVLLAVVTFLAAATYDWCAAGYVRASADRKARKAAFWSMATVAVGIVGLSTVLQYSRWMLVPELLGVWLGTFYGVSRHGGQAS